MFIFKGREAHSRSAAKAISWRLLGSIDTFLLSYLFTSDVKSAGAIASTEVITKVVLFYFHERAWSSIRWGFAGDQEDKSATAEPSAQTEDPQT
ncbi:DUF2061 domain-containing protein [Croceicoccus sediminis]|uniref:DUF2061 domain-containing protein n=1 Tax=Croceicoccus sediminis TaxID=2571150 RepID=UPI001183E97B|nr:DUF2061 domain-containing protein [Croceicoccus sediminis]